MSIEKLKKTKESHFELLYDTFLIRETQIYEYYFSSNIKKLTLLAYKNKSILY